MLCQKISTFLRLLVHIVPFLPKEAIPKMHPLQLAVFKSMASPEIVPFLIFTSLGGEKRILLVGFILPAERVSSCTAHTHSFC